MPNAKVLAGSTRLGQSLPRPARPLADHRGDLERLGPPAIRGAIPGPAGVGGRFRGQWDSEHRRDPRPGPPRLFRPERDPVSITTSLETISVPDAGPAPSPAPPPELLRARACGAAGDPPAGRRAGRRRGRGGGDSGLRRRHGRRGVSARRSRTLQEKVERLDREARTADEQRRRSIVEASHAGRGRGQEGVRHREPPDRHGVRHASASRPGTRPAVPRARSPPSFDAGQLKAAKEHSAAIKPILDLAQHGRRASASGSPRSPPTTRSSASTPSPRSPPRRITPSSRIPSTSCSTGSPGWKHPSSCSKA